MDDDAMALMLASAAHCGKRVVAVKGDEEAGFMDWALGEQAPGFPERVLHSLGQVVENVPERVTWRYYWVSNGAFFLLPDSVVLELDEFGEEGAVMDGDNGDEDDGRGPQSPSAAGLFATAVALSNLAYQSREALPFYRYRMLRDFMAFHCESTRLLRDLE